MKQAQLLALLRASWYRWSTRGLGSGLASPLRRRLSSMLMEGT
jgi:hypothetical protein